MLLANQARTSSSTSTPSKLPFPPPSQCQKLLPPVLIPLPFPPLARYRASDWRRDAKRCIASCNYEARLPCSCPPIPLPVPATSPALLGNRSLHSLHSLCGSHKCIMLITGNNFMNLCKRCRGESSRGEGVPPPDKRDNSPAILICVPV